MRGARALAPLALLAVALVFPPSTSASADVPGRSEKEAFHAGNEGTTFLEVSAITLAVPAGVAARRALDVLRDVRVTPGGILVNARGAPLDPLHVIFKDFVFCVFPAVAAMLETTYSLPIIALLSVLFVSFGIYKLTYHTPNFLDASPRPFGVLDAVGASRPYLSAYRATMTLTTAVAILACDFPAFPRRLGKTETFGVSLMDVGAGSFVLANALVSRREGGRASRWSGAPRGATSEARRVAKQVVPLALLAAVRALSTAATGYHVPVGEYGRHWNFFATLAVVTAVAHVAPLPTGHSATAGALTLAAHQWALTGPGGPRLTRWITSEDRGESFVEENKEGIGSIPGYLALYYLGVAVGVRLERSMVAAAASARAAFERDLDERVTRDSEAAAEAASSARTNTERALALHLKSIAEETNASAVRARRAGMDWKWARRWAEGVAAAAGGAWIAALVAHETIEPASRRSCNAAYALWMIAFNLQTIAAFAWTGVLFPHAPSSPKLLQATNRTLLPTFLVANLLTGAVNLAFDAMRATTQQAWLILTGYMVVVCGFAVVVGSEEGHGDRRRRGVPARKVE